MAEAVRARRLSDEEGAGRSIGVITVRPGYSRKWSSFGS